jgi:phospholipid-binding lipoprotein MlaA
MTLQTNKIARRISFASVAAAIVMFVAMSFTSVPAARAAVPADIQNRIVQTAATWRASTEQQKLVSPDPHMAAITGAMNRRVYSSMMAQAVMDAISRNPANAAEATKAAFQAAPELKNDIIQNLTTAFPAMASTFAAPFPPIRAPPVVRSVPQQQPQPKPLPPVAKQVVEDTDDDPLEGFNRVMFGINDFLDTWVLVPVAEVYRFIMPETLREMGRNFFENLNEPVVAINDLLQGDLENAGVAVGRFVVNSTIGLFGFFEVAEEIDLKAHPADFGQTLHSYGLDSGPYLVLPFFGPSTVRDAVGSGVDSFLNPLSYILDFETRVYLKGSELVVKREEFLDEVEELKKGSVDYYAAFRAAWRQRRAEELRKGKPAPIENIDTLFEDVK